jgi:copper chaperone
MIAFEVKDMTCGHCVSTITKAVKAADKDAKVQIDLAAHRVEIEPTETNVTELSDAIKEAGYTPVELSAGTARAPAARSAGGCCGTC